MTILCRAVLSVLVPLSWALPAAAQQSANPTAQETGTIEGRVYAADTNAPIRAASLNLTIAQAGKSPSFSDITDFTQTVAVGSSHLDGSFSFIHLKPGRYYVYALAPGYLVPAFNEESKAAAARAKIGQKSSDQPTGANPILIDLGPAQTVQADFQLERGAAVQGQVSYDDGSPMTFTRVRALRKDPAGNWKELANGISLTVTDDLGHYRIAGLPLGEYLIEANAMIGTDSVFKADLMEPEHPSIADFRVYSGNVFDEKDATPFKLARGEDRPGEDLIFRISALHRISGIVVAQQDGHPLPDAKVELDAVTDGHAVDSVNVLNSSGAFHLEFVPEGRYTLKVSGARDVNAAGQTQQEYDPAQQPLVVQNDVDGLAISLSPQKPKNGS